MGYKQGGLLRVDTSLPTGLTPDKEVTSTWNGITYSQLYIPGGKKDSGF